MNVLGSLGTFTNNLFGETDVNTTVEGHSEGIKIFNTVRRTERKSCAEHKIQIHFKSRMFRYIILAKDAERNPLVSRTRNISYRIFNAINGSVINNIWSNKFDILIVIIVVNIVGTNF